MNRKPPQKAFTELFAEDLTYDPKSRKKKANKISAVLMNMLGDTKKLSCLDVGSSMGYISEYLSPNFKTVVGVDVDETAINFAKKRVLKKNVKFVLSKERKLPFGDSSFDVAVFNQVYEHVQSPAALLKEIKRVLKKDGVCFFGARNKYGIFDGHYSLPFIAWIPKVYADFYVKRLLGKKEYDINLYSLGELKNLTSQFNITDYTIKVIESPQKYFVDDIVPEGRTLHKCLIILSKILYPLIPNYIWVLRKK